MAQHADQDREFQRSVLAMIEPLVKTGEVSGMSVAYLYDRTHTPQRYGTQGACTATHSWVPNEIEDAQHVDQRRAEIMLPSMAQYAALASSALCGPVADTTPARSSSPDK